MKTASAKTSLLQRAASLQAAPSGQSVPVQFGSLVYPWAKEPNENADFLIVTALREERDALFRHLPGAVLVPARRDTARVYYATEIAAKVGDQEGDYRVVVAPLLEMGGKEALSATQDAIRLWTPSHILLVGIAGGCAANGVRLGDLLVPGFVADYSLGKIKGRREEIRWAGHPTDMGLAGRVEALTLPENHWMDTVKEQRPTGDKPMVHRNGTVATGDKVIAARRLLETITEAFPKLLGVEMEAHGVAKACFDSTAQPRFLMIKSVSDLADEDKDEANTESWRAYANDVAAAFAVALIRSGPIPFRTAV
jgi:nucleoside phosphorylase